MSQIPSAASIRARQAERRYDRCPTCQNKDVSGLHVARCADSKRYRDAAVDVGNTADVPEVTTADLWAHLNSRTHNELISAQVVQLVLDLGWRPVVGSDERRLWSPSDNPTSPEVPWCDCGLRPEHLHDEDGVPYDPRLRLSPASEEGSR